MVQYPIIEEDVLLIANSSSDPLMSKSIVNYELRTRLEGAPAELGERITSSGDVRGELEAIDPEDGVSIVLCLSAKNIVTFAGQLYIAPVADTTIQNVLAMTILCGANGLVFCPSVGDYTDDVDVMIALGARFRSIKDAGKRMGVRVLDIAPWYRFPKSGTLAVESLLDHGVLE